MEMAQGSTHVLSMASPETAPQKPDAGDKKKEAPAAVRIAEIGPNLAIWKAPLLVLREQRKNARAMDGRTFSILAETISRDKRLESLPLVTWQVTRGGTKELEIISGHHRIRAAAAANMTEIYVIVDESELTRDEIVQKQLAHNAINGTDDPSILKELLDEISSADLMRLTGLSLDSMMPPDIGKQLEQIVADMKYEPVVILFLPEQFSDWTEILNRFADQNEIQVAGMAQFEEFKKAIKAIGRNDKCRNIAAQLDVYSKIVIEHYAKRNANGAEADAKAG